MAAASRQLDSIRQPAIGNDGRGPAANWKSPAASWKWARLAPIWQEHLCTQDEPRRPLWTAGRGQGRDVSLIGGRRECTGGDSV
jgi:hypothetical protein